MPKRSLVSLLAVLVFVSVGAACGDGDDDGLVRIKRLEFDVSEHALRVYGEVVPPVAHSYPDVVARVNGEAMTGDALMEREVRLENERLSYERNMSQVGLTEEEMAPLIAQFEEADPLELLIEDALLRQAVAREGTLASREEVEESLRLQEESILAGLERLNSEDRAEFEAAIRLMGYPESDWPSDERIVEYLRGQGGLARLREQVCGEPPDSPMERDPMRPGGRDCAAFLTAERAAADIVYFVRWAD